MTTPPVIKTRLELFQDWIRRVVTYTDRVTWFGTNSIVGAWGRATATLTESTHQLYGALLRRILLSAATGDWLVAVARERGANQRSTTTAGAFVVVQPVYANVASITIAAAPGFDDLNVDDGTLFLVGDEVRVRNGAGTVTDVRLIALKPTANTIRVATLIGAYTPATDDVDVLFRISLAEGDLVRATNGTTFALTEPVTTSDHNAVLDGESTSLALADKAWAEATTRGSSGNVEALAINRLSTPVRGIRAVYNPGPATGGGDTEPDYELRYRAANWPEKVAQETEAALQALAHAADEDVLRAKNATSTVVGTMRLFVAHRGGAFSASQLEAIQTFVEDRLRTGLTVEAINATLTSLWVEAEITVDNGASLEGCWRAAASRLADYVDRRTWEWGGTVNAADLLVLVRQTTGIASVDSSTFLPAADLPVGADSLPAFVGLTLRDSTTGKTFNAALAQSW